MDGLLKLIAQPQVADPYGSFMQGGDLTRQRAALALEANTKAQTAQQQQTLEAAQGTPGYDAAFEKFAVQQPEKATTIQALTKGINETNQKKIFGLLQTAQTMPTEEARNQLLEYAKPLVKNNQSSSYLLETLQKMTIEQSGNILNELTAAGQQQGVLKAAQKTPAQIQQTLDISKQQADTASVKNALKRIELNKPSTDAERYVVSRVQQGIAEGKPLTQKQIGDAYMEIRREQAPEAYDTKEAEERAKLKHTKDIAYQATLGDMTAKIEQTPELLKAEGQITEADKKSTAKTNMGRKIASMVDAYNELDKVRAITNTKRGAVSNMVSFARSSSMGQFFGKSFGTEPQAFRNYIVAIQANLLGDIRKAADMGVKGLDTPKEMEFYLKMTSDVHQDFQANMAALALLDETLADGKMASIIRKELDVKWFKQLEDKGSKIKREALRFKKTNKATPEAAVKALKSGEPFTAPDGQIYFKR